MQTTSDETIIGNLNEYQQKIFRISQSWRVLTDDIIDRFEDIKAVSETSLSLGVSSEQSRAEDFEKAKDLFDKLDATIQEWMTVYHIFQKEIEYTFENEISLFEVVGVREGNILIGRNDNKRNDTPEKQMICLSSFRVVELLMKKWNPSKG